MAQSNVARTCRDPAFADAELELLLPWYVAGALDEADSRRISSALASNPALVREYAAIRREQAALVGAVEPTRPSLRPLVALFAAIDAEAASPANVIAFKVAGATRFAPERKDR